MAGRVLAAGQVADDAGRAGVAEWHLVHGHGNCEGDRREID
jgi:hypothetical protein